MDDSSDCSSFLDSLFFGKPVVHKVKPLQQEIGLWQQEVAPSPSEIQGSPCLQEEAESLFPLSSNSQKDDSFLPLSHTLKVFAGLEGKTYSCDYNREILVTCGSSCSNAVNACDVLWEGEGFGDCYTRSDRGRGESLQDSSHVENTRRPLALDCSKDPPLRKSLFKVQKSKSGSDSDISNSSSSVSSSSNLTASRPQTFLSQVAMATTLPSQQLPRVTVCKADLSALPRKPPLPPPLLGSSAACGRPLEGTTDSEMADKVTKRAFVPPMTPQPLCIQGSSGAGVLRSVSEIPSKFRPVFKDFPFFNYVQSKALDDILYTDKNFVACAPTGSGKTVLFELAIIRLLMETSEPWRDVKAVYIAPIKALCSQCFENWQKKFGPLGLSCKELTGDTEIDDFFEIQDSHIILTTPEKWDSMTRKWKDNCLLQLVRLFLIDEVHVVKDTTRGATLEVVVSRMKTVQTYRNLLNPETGFSMRFVAVSATIPNISDIADWLSNEVGPATYLELGESHRPVKLRKVVLGFPCGQNQTEFKFDLSLNYKMASVIQTYSDRKPALVFCSTRKGAQQSAGVLAKDARFIMSIDHKQRLIQYGNSLQDIKLRDLVMLGVGYHHAGVSLSDRKVVEEAFTHGELPVLFTTRTLAMGVNLPAHLVVIKSTTQYVSGSCEEYSEADLLQMIGRAGRPQFDTSATAVIMTKEQTRDKYAKLMNGVEIIESSLHSHLVEHLNAEIVLQTVSDVNMALDWIRSTFLYIRALKNPAHYGFSADLDRRGIEAKLQELCLKNLNSLASIDLIHMDEVINIKPTDAGKLMARYCVAFDTMKQFCQVTGTENLSDLIELVSKSKEFSTIQLRVNEKKALNTLNKDKNRTTIRFPLEGKIKTAEMKVNCLIQAHLGSIPIQEFGLSQETVKIFRNGLRISKCLSEVLSQKSKTGFSALLNSLILAKCFRAKLWENSPYVSKQLEKIGQTLSTAMVNAGLTSFSKIEQIHARELELIVNRHPPFGNQIKESVIHLPMYEVTLEQLPRYSCATAEIVVKVNLRNQAQLLSKRTAPDHHYVSLILGDTDNNAVFLQKIPDMVLLKCGTWSKKIEVMKASKGEEISVNLISSEYVGLDIHQKFNVYYSGARKFGTHNPNTLSCNSTGSKPQQPTPNSPPRHQCLSQQEVTTFVNKQDVPNKRECNHFCKNKELCGHDCCKVGVSVAKKRTMGQESGFSSYLSDLRTRCDTLVQTPVKRLKMKMNQTSLSVNIQEFAYQPQAKLPSVSRFERAHCEPLVKQNLEIVDLTGENFYDPKEKVHLDNTDNDYYETDGDISIVEEIPAALLSHYPSSFVWQKQETSGWSQGLRQSTNQINNSSSGYYQTQSLTPVTSKVTQGHAASSFQIPTVSFDLGNEWDDWSDFDDEKLVHAAQISNEPDLKIQKNQENKIPGEAATAIISSFQAQPNMNATRTPLRTISSMVTVRPENKHTPDWNKKRLSIFHNQQTLKTLETHPEQTPQPQAAMAFDFFSTLGVGAHTSSHVRGDSINKREEEAFFGIFDGIL